MPAYVLHFKVFEDITLSLAQHARMFRVADTQKMSPDYTIPTLCDIQKSGKDGNFFDEIEKFSHFVMRYKSLSHQLAFSWFGVCFTFTGQPISSD